MIAATCARPEREKQPMIAAIYTCRSTEQNVTDKEAWMGSLYRLKAKSA